MNKRLVPGLVLGLLIIGLGLLYGPKLVRGYEFRQAIVGLLQNVKSGHIKHAMAYVSPSQRQQATTLTSAALGPDYHTNIQSLKLTDVRWLDETTISANVICKLDWDGATPIYQGKLLWRYWQGVWVWDFEGSYVGEFAGFEQPAWVKLGEMLTSVESY